jgi:hypothetical protein
MTLSMRVFAPLCLLVSALLAACGGGGGDDPSREDTEAAAAGSNAVPQKIPKTLWQPPQGATPVAGNYVYLASDAGDYIGQGRSRLYTQLDAVLTLQTQKALLSMIAHGDQRWEGSFAGPNSFNSIKAGYYPSLQRYPFHDTNRGGLNWSGEGRGCNTLTGWYAVDSVAYLNGALSAIELRFEQHCEGTVPALRGKIRWTFTDLTQPAGPVSPPPPALWQAPAGATPAAGNYVYLQSDSGDFIGQGATDLHTLANATMTFTPVGSYVKIGVNGSKAWTGDFQAMVGLTQLQPGYYGNLQRYPFHNPAKGGMAWSGNGRACNTLSGWFVVDSVSYSGSTLNALSLRFEQFCEGQTTAALRGQIRWSANDTTVPPGPVFPPPATLWQPAAGATPASGNYVFLQSDAGDYIGQGATRTYTQANASLTTSASNGLFHIGVSGYQGWSGDFKAMSELTQLQPGYYANLARFPFHNPTQGGLNWSGDGRGCNALSGWFVVDSVSYVAGTLASIELRFEQHCEGAVPALRGKIRWSSSDTTAPSGPVNPPPADLWQPIAGATPASGNYVVLQSDSGDYIGAGATSTYTQGNAVLAVTVNGGRASVTVNGAQYWSGDFQAMNTLAQLQPGYYGGLTRYPFHNPTVGGLNWSGNGRGCNTLTGWFVIDSITYTGGALSAIELRFEQHCEGAAPALRGKIRWSSSDTTAPGGPVNPPPPDLWQPAPGATPATGNYVFLQSDGGDYIGQGATSSYTQANAVLAVSVNAGRLGVSVNGSQYWSGDFQAMNTVTLLQPGYYGNLQRYPFHNPTTGGLSWSGDGRGCNTLTGWFVVDSISYSNGALASVDLRFEQHCEGQGPALRGKIHWASGDATAPAGPVNPPPSNLWQPPTGVTPASGNFVYLQSDSGDYIGAGQTYLYTPANATLTFNATGGRLSVGANGSTSWSGDFQAMNVLTSLQPGYYGNLQRYPFHNPALGGLSWSGDGRGCNRLGGWFVVDSVSYEGAALTSIDLRFEQHCEGMTPALRGRVRWTR